MRADLAPAKTPETMTMLDEAQFRRLRRSVDRRDLVGWLSFWAQIRFYETDTGDWMVEHWPWKERVEG